MLPQNDKAAVRQVLAAEVSRLRRKSAQQEEDSSGRSSRITVSEVRGGEDKWSRQQKEAERETFMRRRDCTASPLPPHLTHLPPRCGV